MKNIYIWQCINRCLIIWTTGPNIKECAWSVFDHRKPFRYACFPFKHCCHSEIKTKTMATLGPMISLSSVSGRLNAFLMDCEGGTLFFILTPSQGFGSDKWRPCPSEEPDTDGNSSFLLEGRTWEGWGSTCGILDHSHHRTEAGRHSQMCHKHCSTCTQCTASGKSSQLPSSQQWTAGTKDVLNVHSQSRTPVPQTGLFSGSCWSRPGRSHNSHWVTPGHLVLS